MSHVASTMASHDLMRDLFAKGRYFINNAAAASNGTPGTDESGKTNGRTNTSAVGQDAAAGKNAATGQDAAASQDAADGQDAATGPDTATHPDATARSDAAARPGAVSRQNTTDRPDAGTIRHPGKPHSLPPDHAGLRGRSTAKAPDPAPSAYREPPATAANRSRPRGRIHHPSLRRTCRTALPDLDTRGKMAPPVRPPGPPENEPPATPLHQHRPGKTRG
ncbi:beta-glucanase precursor [Lasius niger]|uniref:Beta-glucanase n=1 Tax=Lasius niger TaxID=67767 RepID=A0A0J7KA91_LASNI|nr:beta-glucanase precursor [Lasius niger]